MKSIAGRPAMRADDQGNMVWPSNFTKGMMCFPTFRPKESAREKNSTPMQRWVGRLPKPQQSTRILLEAGVTVSMKKALSSETGPLGFLFTNWMRVKIWKVGNHKAHFARTESRPLSEPSIFNNYGARSLRNKQSNTFPALI